MNSSITTLDRPASPLNSATILTQNGFNCTCLTIGPGQEAILPASPSPDDQLLFVLEGQITILTGRIATVVKHDDAFLLAPGRDAVITSLGEKRARVLRVEIPPRQIITPQIITARV